MGSEDTDGVVINGESEDIQSDTGEGRLFESVIEEGRGGYEVSAVKVDRVDVNRIPTRGEIKRLCNRVKELEGRGMNSDDIRGERHV